MKRHTYELPPELDQTARKNTGAFYTPDHIVDFMVSEVLRERRLPLRICDFSCGGGAFLSGVLRYVRKHAPECCSECCRNLTGIDINPRALELARKNLPDIPKENFICADTLELDFPGEKKFDIIIGNPPYRCGGVKNNAAFSAEQQKKLKNRFNNSFEYKMNLFALFVEQSTRMAEEFSLIVPDSLLCGRYFSKLRRYLTEKFFLKGIYLLEKPSFDAAPGNAVIIHGCAGKVPSTPSLKCACFAPGKLETAAGSDFYLTDQRRFAAESRCRFQLAFSERQEKLVRKLLAPGPRVRDLFSFASGIISRKGKHSIIASPSETDAVPGIIYGREIHPFETAWEGGRLRISAENIKSGLNHERYAGEKIFVRQTGSQLIAAVCREKIYALNNCHVGTALSDFPADTLTALLNSTLMNSLYRYLSGEHNRNFAQIDIDLLNALPLRRTPEFDRFAAECARDPRARKELDAHCARLFELTPEEIRLADSFLSPSVAAVCGIEP